MAQVATEVTIGYWLDEPEELTPEELREMEAELVER